MPQPLPSPLYFVRHGQTSWNVLGLFQGHSDIPLNEHGRSDARRVTGLFTDYFKAMGQKPDFARIVSSPLSRAMETAHIVCLGLGIEPARIVAEPRLMEQNYGQWEGRTLTQIRELFPGSAERQFASLRTFTADGGESMPHLAARVLSAVMELPPHSLCVGHFGTLFSLMLTHWGAIPEHIPREIPQGAFYLIEDEHIACFRADAPDGMPFFPSDRTTALSF